MTTSNTPDQDTKPAIGSFRGKPIDENMSKTELLNVIEHLVKQSQADREAADRMQKFMEEHKWLTRG